MDERLRLIAELRDNMSSGLAKINKELKGTKRTPGMEQAQKWFSGFNDVTKETLKSGREFSGLMGTIGVGGLTAATSLGVLTRQMKELADHVFTMKRLGQETRMTIDEVHRWEYVGQVFHVPVEQMDAALKELGDKMVDFRRRRGELFGQLAQMAPEETTKLLGMKDADAQFHEVLRWLSTIKDTALRNRWTREFFGTDEIAGLLTNGMPALEKAIAQARSKVAPVTPEMQKQADDLSSAIVGLNETLNKFELTTGPAFLKTLTGIVELMTKAADVFSKPKDLVPHIGQVTPEQAGKLKEGRRQFDKNPWFYLNPKHWIGHQKPDDDGAKKTAYDSAGFGDLLKRTAFEETSPAAPQASSATPFGFEATIASGTKIGVLAAFREWAAERSAGDAGGGAGIISASYETGSVGGGSGGIARGGGDGASGGGAAPDSRRSAAPLGKIGDGGDPDVTPDAGVISRFTKEGASEGFNTRGVRNLNPGNIGFGKWAQEHGAIGSAGSDTGHGVAVFPSFEAGYKAMNELALSKYGSGMRSMNQIIAGAHGWTPGNMSAAANVARYMGIGPNDDAHLDDPGMLSKFRAGLSVQELGPAGARYAFSQMGARYASGAGSNPVDIAKGMLGFGEGQAAKALGHYMHSGEWCADFVNGSLAKSGSSGTKSAMAASFFQWGRRVEPGSAQKGDVMVSGHHVGFAEGPAQMHNGRLMMPMISGNHGHRVSESWEPVGKYEVHRAIGSLAEEARKNRERSEQAANDGSIEAHVHIHQDGQVRGARAKSSGSVKPPKVHLQRGPTMTEPSISA